jgi:hypothetical protein
MSTRFFTNSGDNTLLNKFKGIFENNRDIEFGVDTLPLFAAQTPEELRPEIIISESFSS